MQEDSPQVHRLVRWNRFWLAVVVVSLLVGGFNYGANRLISFTQKLEVRWSVNESSEDALVFSSAQGGPFVVTQMVSGGRDPHTSTDAIAQLPRPLFVRGPKSRTYFSARQLAQLNWINSEGEKVAAPKPGTPILVLYYETRRVMTTE